ncbi:unnamed protein product [Hyaloperonospora brassicae]|uniref:RxLR effector candidate protein n=1 Tax=Hyaloperonospora brassicae TaxID=162125 RepID=A0AAV0UES2_HYABA|nr:unnamed protein product [Hyaloperonospora brassicae]
MHLFCRLFTASAIVLWRSAGSTTVGSDRTNEAARAIATVPLLRHEANASFASTEHLQPPNLAVDATGHDHPSDDKWEVRSILSRLADGVDALRVRMSIFRPRDVVGILERLDYRPLGDATTNVKKLMEWYQRIEKLRAKGYAFEDDMVAEYLLKKKPDGNVLKAFLRQVRAQRAERESPVSGLEKALAAKDPKLLGHLARVWLKSGVRPDEVYQVMPIAAMRRLEDGVRTDEDWLAVRRGVESWLDYVHEFNRKYPVSVYDQEAVVDHLVGHRGMGEAMELLESFKPLNRGAFHPNDCNYPRQIVSDALTSYSETEVRAFRRDLRADRNVEDVAQGIEKVLSLRDANLKNERQRWFSEGDVKLEFSRCVQQMQVTTVNRFPGGDSGKLEDPCDCNGDMSRSFEETWTAHCVYTHLRPQDGQAKRAAHVLEALPMLHY